MVTRRSSILHPFNQLRSELDRQFSELWGNGGGIMSDFALRGRAFPAVNIWEKGEHLYAETEVPGAEE